MKNIVRILSVCLLAAGAAQADVVTNLDFATTGNYLNSAATVVLTSQSYNGATFDIAYTLGSDSGTNTNPFARSIETQYGVGSDQDISQHYTTLEGADTEGISFTGLSIVNFLDNGSAVTTDDITGLKSTAVSWNNTGNVGDGVGISFTAYTNDIAQINLRPVGPSTTIDLTAYSAADDLYLLSTGGGRWAVTGVTVSYAIPEPATLGMVAAFGGGILFIRRRFMI